MSNLFDTNAAARDFVLRFTENPRIQEQIGAMFAPYREQFQQAAAQVFEHEGIPASVKFDLPNEAKLHIEQASLPPVSFNVWVDEDALVKLFGAESARIAGLISKVSDQLGKAVIADIKLPTSDELLTAAKRIGVGGGAHVSPLILPPNLWALAEEDDIVTRVYDFIESQPIPLHTIPTSGIAKKLLDADTEDERLEVIEEHAETLVHRCAVLVAKANMDVVENEVAHFNEALAAFEAGLYRASLVTSAGLIDAGIRRRAREAGTAIGAKRNDVMTRSKNEKKVAKREALLDEMLIMEYSVWIAVWNAYSRFDGDSGHPPPTIFNRHACAHSVVACQYSRANAVVGIMNAALVVTVLDRYDGQSWKLP